MQQILENDWSPQSAIKKTHRLNDTVINSLISMLGFFFVKAILLKHTLNAITFIMVL